MSKKNDAQLELEISTNESRASLGAWAIVVGLMFEVALAAAVTFGFENKTIEGWSTVAATLLIAAGVYAEIHFGRKASDAHKALRAISDERVAETNATAARANERAAVLEKEAAEARERTAEIERLTSWRHITWEQEDKVVRAIRRNLPDDILIEYPLFDIEAAMYASALAKLFLEADAKGVLSQGYADLNENSLMFGLYVSSTQDIYTNTVLDAFRDAGIRSTKDSPRAAKFFK